MNGSFSILIAALLNMVVGKAAYLTLGPETFAKVAIGVLLANIALLLMKRRIADVPFWFTIFFAGYALPGMYWWAAFAMTIVYIMADVGIISIEVRKK